MFKAKKIVSAAIAFVMAASMMAATASAAIYVKPAPIPGDVKVPTPAAAAATPSASTGSSSSYKGDVNIVAGGTSSGSAVDVSKKINAASVSGEKASVSIDSTNGVKVQSSVLKKLKAAKGDVTFEIVAPGVTISIDSSKIKSAKKLNLSMKVSNSTKQSRVKFIYKSEFGCEVKLVLTNCKISKANLKKASVYYVDGATSTKVGAVELNDKGQPVITATKGGTYVVK